MSDPKDIHKPDSELNQGAQDVVRILRWFFTILTVLMLTCVAYYFVSGVFILESGEHAAVFRFGALVDTKEKEELYWAMPRYIDDVEEVSVTKRHTFESSYFWFKTEPETALMSPDRQQDEASEEGLEVGKDGYHLTADNNIIHSKWSLVYRVSDITDYLTRYEQPEEAIHLALKNAVLKASSQLKINEIQEDGGSRLRTMAKKQVLDETQAMEIGVEILEVNLLKISVPRATKKAFDSVTDASNIRDKFEKDARGYAGSERENAEALARQILEEASAYKQNIIDSVVADADYMTEILPQYRQFGASILLTEYVDTLVSVLGAVEQIQLVHPGQEVRVTFEPRMDIKHNDNAGHSEEH